MAVNYKLYQCTREGKFKNMWYARATHNGTVDTEQLATIMQANCTVKRSDIVAVLTELVEVMTEQLQNSMRVKLDGFGTFKIGISSSPAESAKEFGQGNIRGLHVLFQPEGKRDVGTNTMQRTFLKAVKVREASLYNVDKGEADAGSKPSPSDTGDDAEGKE